uniref:Uncharacterized protein n=1 Tax=Cucumis melo TaxID=3656 RepID=A0A9I9DTP4_CUCME
MKYKGSEVTRKVTWIIFYEVHYMCDWERGVVREESIVMTPKNARFVFLSNCTKCKRICYLGCK